MKNKLLYLVLSLMLCFSFAERVFADKLDFTVSATVADGRYSVVKGENVTINVNVKSDLYIGACTFIISSDSGLENVSATTTGDYVLQGGGIDGMLTVDGPVAEWNGNAITTPTNTSLLQLVYKVNDNGKVTIKTRECAAPVNSTRGSHDDVVVELKTIEPTVDTSLSKLSVTGGALSPNFSSTTMSYTIHLSGTNFSLGLTASNSDFQDDIEVIDANGNKLDPKQIKFVNYNGQGSMPIKVIVNKDSVYNLLAVYEEEKLDNSLKSLKVDGKEIKIENGKYDYTVKIGSNTKSVRIDATLVDSKNFKFTSDFGGSKSVATTYSNTKYAIIVEPTNSSNGGRTATYTINLVKDTTGSGGNSSSSGGGNSSSNGGGYNSGGGQNIVQNPVTGSISVFVMIVVLVGSLIGSICIYRKNLSNN